MRRINLALIILATILFTSGDFVHARYSQEGNGVDIITGLKMEKGRLEAQIKTSEEFKKLAEQRLRELENEAKDPNIRSERFGTMEERRKIPENTIREEDKRIARYQKQIENLNKQIAKAKAQLPPKAQTPSIPPQQKQQGIIKPPKNGKGPGKGPVLGNCILAIPELHRGRLEVNQKAIKEKIQELEAERAVLEKELREAYELYGQLTPVQRLRLLTPQQIQEYQRKYQRYSEIVTKISRLNQELERVSYELLVLGELAEQGWFFQPVKEIVNACLSRLRLID